MHLQWHGHAGATGSVPGVCVRWLWLLALTLVLVPGATLAEDAESLKQALQTMRQEFESMKQQYERRMRAGRPDPHLEAQPRHRPLGSDPGAVPAPPPGPEGRPRGAADATAALRHRPAWPDLALRSGRDWRLRDRFYLSDPGATP
jgi:hypothetical protein